MRILYGGRANAILFNYLRSNDISGKVILPANMCDTVTAAYIKAGMQVVLCDLDPRDWQPDRNRIMELLKEDGSISVLHYSHTYGYEGGEENELFKTAAEEYPSLVIIDDRCLCRPSAENDDGRCSTMTLFSTGSKKYADLGRGAFALVKESRAGAKYSCHVLEYSKEEEKRFEEESKRCIAQGTALSEEVIWGDWLDTRGGDLPEDYPDRVKNCCRETEKHKAVINRIYEGLPGSMGMRYNTWRYNVLAENQGECVERLFREGLFASAHYSNTGRRFGIEGDMYWCDRLYRHVINLFNDYAYTPEQAEKTREILQETIIPWDINI